MTVDVLSAMDSSEATLLKDSIIRLRDQGALPTPADIAANIISFNIVAGTLLSLLLAIALSTRSRVERYRNNKCNL